MNKKTKKILSKFVALLMVIAFILSNSSIPTVVVYAKEKIIEQNDFKKILNDDSQQVFIDIPITETPITETFNISTEINKEQLAEQEQEKTEQQKKDEYKVKIKDEDDSLTYSRYIVSYSNDEEFDTFVKKLDKKVNKK